LLVLATEDRQKPIITYIDSPGGSAGEALNVISTMNGIRSPVVTFCRGAIGGAAAIIAAHGLKGFRIADPGTHFSLGLGNESSGENSAEVHESYLKMLAQILATDTAKDPEYVLRWLIQGVQFSAQEAIHQGLIDGIAREPVLPSVL
jgi:ATP-dependent Clp protease protease subunit